MPITQPKAGTLYIVTTPIGNLADLTPRAADVLQKVDFIAAEDTRVTLKLLNHLQLKKPLVSYNQHNAHARGTPILARIQAGESCALCSDAGTPAISDPGEFLVTQAHELGLKVEPVPGVCAAITALSVSGQATGRFVFEGFVTQNKRQRRTRLQELQQEPRTIILYEAPHKLPTTLCDLEEFFGADRPMTVCRELTKLHEEIWPTTVGQAKQRYTQETPRGEFVLVLAGAPEAASAPQVDLAQAAQLAVELAEEEGLPASEAAKRIAQQTGYPKSAIYREMQTLNL